MTTYNSTVQKYSNSEVCFGVEQDSSIHIKALTNEGDPVELSKDEAMEIGKALIELADQLR